MRGRSLVVRAFGLLVLFAAPWLRAQTPGREQFEDLSRRAQAALDSRPDEAIQLYKQALGIRPDWPEGWLYMGALFIRGAALPKPPTLCERESGWRRYLRTGGLCSASANPNSTI